MLEVLVAVFVLALGVLGGAAMQLAAQRARYESGLQSQAAYLAGALAERMRANPAVSYLGFDYDAAAEPHPGPPAQLCHGGACSPDALAAFDWYELKLLVRERLPGGRALVCRDSAIIGGRTLTWACSGGAAAPAVIKLGWRARRPDGAADAGADGGARPGVALMLGVSP
jgi:type IV pilus assembly protein PilV